MGYADKIKDQAEQVKDKAKEWVGDKTDNESSQSQGSGDQFSRMKKGAEELKNATQDFTGS